METKASVDSRENRSPDNSGADEAQAEKSLKVLKNSAKCERTKESPKKRDNVNNRGYERNAGEKRRVVYGIDVEKSGTM